MKEHPNWLPSWLGYAQYGETILTSNDRDLAPGGREIFHGYRPNRYDVIIGPEPCELTDGCEKPGVPHGRVLWTGNDRRDAMRAFEAAQLELLGAVRLGERVSQPSRAASAIAGEDCDGSGGAEAQGA